MASSPRKILFVITKSNWGGAQAYVYALATAYARMGHAVSVALGGTGGAGAEIGLLADRLAAAGIQVHPIPSFMRDISLSHEFRAFNELREIIRSTQPDVIHLNSSKAGGIGALAGRLERVPHIIFTAHGWAHREPRSFLKRVLIWLSSVATTLLSHSIIVVSGQDYRDAPTRTKKKVHLIHNGVSEFSLLDRNEAREKLSTKFGIQKGTWVFMQSELHPNKGVDVAIRAVQTLLSTHADMRLVVFGEGQERKKLEELITRSELGEHVFLLGFIPDSRMYLAAGDMFLMTSYKEGLPMALLEAGRAGLPVVASATGGIPEIIKNEETGLLANPGNSLDFAHQIERLLDNPQLCERFSKALTVHIHEEFSEEKMLTETLHVYES